MARNMTGLGKYQRGMELEAKGAAAKRIAEDLGYKDVQAWYAAKAYYGKKTAAFNARAAGKDTETGSETAPLLEMPEPKTTLLQDAMAAGMAGAGKELAQHVKEVLKQKPQFAPKAIAEPMPETRLSKLKISVETTAVGEFLEYHLMENGQVVQIYWHGDENPIFNMVREKALVIAEELRELLNI